MAVGSGVGERTGGGGGGGGGGADSVGGGPVGIRAASPRPSPPLRSATFRSITPAPRLNMPTQTDARPPRFRCSRSTVPPASRSGVGDLPGRVDVAHGTAGAGVVAEHRLAVAGRFRDLDAPWDPRAQNRAAE